MSSNTAKCRTILNLIGIKFERQSKTDVMATLMTDVDAARKTAK